MYLSLIIGHSSFANGGSGKQPPAYSQGAPFYNAWESGAFAFRRISKRGGKRGKLVFAFGVFHAFLGASFPQRGARAFFEVLARCGFAESGSPLALKRPTTCGL